MNKIDQVLFTIKHAFETHNVSQTFDGKFEEYLNTYMTGTKKEEIKNRFPPSPVGRIPKELRKTLFKHLMSLNSHPISSGEVSELINKPRYLTEVYLNKMTAEGIINKQKSSGGYWEYFV